MPKKMAHSDRIKRDTLRRLKRATGQLTSVIRMLENDRNYTDILTQLAAVRGAVTQVGVIITQEHLRFSTQGVTGKRKKEMDALNRVLIKFVSCK
ncbi:MAG: metal-sensitive transcriptional regulator [candidate division Zixibacteria bacterium]|nr:metal-sensitive transcriptional regulator [candidate division Zixibacteria bacterium]